MNIIIFGATGTVGRLVVEQSLKEGHTVTAFARHPEKLGYTHPNLSLIAGDALEAKAVTDAVAGHDAVIVTLGAGASRKSVVRSEGTRNIIRGMHTHGVKRLICQTTLGAHESWSNLNFFWKRIMFGLLLRPVFLDHQRQETLVRESGLEWTLVRPSALTDEEDGSAFKEGFDSKDRNLTLKISRSEVAGFLKRQLFDKAYLNQAVGISH